jgi:DNA-binding response OmpR family regulator
MSVSHSVARPHKIVIVESDEDFLHLIQMTLADCGGELLSAGNGRDGLALISACQPEAVILDLALPDMSGWEVYIQLREHSAARPAPPVIILADEGTRLDRTFSLQVAQVHDYQMKPFLPSQLRKSVMEALRLSVMAEPHTAGWAAIEEGHD